MGLPADSLLKLRVRIPLEEWMSVCCDCCVLCRQRSLGLEVQLRKKERKRERKKERRKKGVDEEFALFFWRLVFLLRWVGLLQTTLWI